MTIASNPAQASLPLFRNEIVAHKSNGELGSIRLTQPVSSFWITIASLAIGAGFVTFLVTGSVTRKAHVAGIVVPSRGSLTIAAPSSGVLIRKMVVEGQYVHADQALFELSTERQVGAGEVSEIVSRQLTAQQLSLDSEQRLRISQNRERQKAMRQRLEGFEAEAKQVQDELVLAKRRYQLAESSMRQYEALQASGYVSSAQVQQKQEDLLDLAARINNIGRSLIQLRSSRRDVKAELDTLDITLADDLSQISRTKSNLAQQMIENHSRKSTIIAARESGIVTTITYQVGQAVNAGQALATIIPSVKKAGKDDDVLGQMEVQIYAPSRAAGFVAPGQEVLIRYQAFPYQKFGLQLGVVNDISATPFAPGELPSNLASTIIGNAQQSINGLSNSEALYRIKVTLARQTIKVYGKDQLLRPGMTLEADIVQDRRKIWEWIAEPLLAVAHR